MSIGIGDDYFCTLEECVKDILIFCSMKNQWPVHENTHWKVNYPLISSLDQIYDIY